MGSVHLSCNSELLAVSSLARDLAYPDIFVWKRETERNAISRNYEAYLVTGLAIETGCDKLNFHSDDSMLGWYNGRNLAPWSATNITASRMYFTCSSLERKDQATTLRNTRERQI